MSIFEPSDLVATSPATNRRQWLIAGSELVLLAAAMIGMFWEAASGAFYVWLGSETFNHCFLIVPIVIYLLWDRRAVFSTIRPWPSPRLLWALPLPILAWLVGDIGAVLELQQFAALAAFQIAVCATIGIQAYRALLFPCLYLFLLVPTGEWLTPALQDWTSWFIANGLELLSIPVYADGVFIEIPNGRFEVAEACAGLRFLIASIAFGALFSGLIYRSWTRRIIFIVLSFVVPIIANGFRALGIVLLAHWSNNRVAVGVDHVVYGWGFFTAILVVLIFVGLRFREDHIAAVPANLPRGGGPARKLFGREATVLCALAIASFGPAYAGYLRRHDSSSTITILSPTPSPWIAGAWRSSWTPTYRGMQGEYRASYYDTAAVVDLYIAAYVDQGAGRKLIGYANRLADGETWRRVADEQIPIVMGDVLRSVDVQRLTGAEGERIVWRLYWVDGGWTPNGFEARARYILNKIIHGRSAAAVVIISSPADQQIGAGRFLTALVNHPGASSLIRFGAHE